MNVRGKFLIPTVALCSISFASVVSQSGTPVFSQVPVIVQRSGKHVSGLKKEDFVLRQDGKDQPIATFEEMQTGQAPKGTEAQPEFGNQAGRIPQQITIIALDMVNTPTLDR